MRDDLLYEERLSSNRTEALFLALTVLFLTLTVWRLRTGPPDVVAFASFCPFAVFALY
jgi:hypothetical protein